MRYVSAVNINRGERISETEFYNKLKGKEEEISKQLGGVSWDFPQWEIQYGLWNYWFVEVREWMNNECDIYGGIIAQEIIWMLLLSLFSHQIFRGQSKTAHNSYLLDIRNLSSFQLESFSFILYFHSFPFKPKSLPSNFPFQIIIKYTICLIHVLNRKTFDIQKRWLKIKLPSVLGLIIRILKLINFTFDNVHKGKWKMWLNEWDILLPAVKYGWDGTHTHCLLSTQTFR